MFAATLVDLNGWGAAWGAWLLAALVDATLVLVVATLVWLAVRRNAAAALGSILFLLVLIKLVVPLEIPVPDAVAHWTPRQVASRWLADLPAADAESSPELAPTPDDATSRPPAEADKFEITVLPQANESIHEPFPEPDFVADASPIAPLPDGPFEAEDVELPVPAVATQPNPLAPAPVVEPATVPVTRPIGEVPATSTARPSFAGLLMLAWLVIAVGLLARSFWNHVRFCRQLRRGRKVDRTELPCDLAELCSRMGVKRHIRVVETDALSSPAVCGILRPVIVLPEGLLGSMPARQLEWILLHELAHIRRHDLVVVWFQWIMATVHFLNPAVWIANRMINRLREYACDDLALTHANASRLDSSEAFMTVVRHAAGRPAAFSGAPGVFDESARASCFRRMTRLLDTKRPLRVRLSVGSLAVVVLAAALALPQLRPAGTTTAAEPPAVKEATESPEVTTKHLTGAVLDRDGQPAAGCTVQLFDYSSARREWLDLVTTDAEGRFKLPVADDKLLSTSRYCAVRAISPDGQRMALKKTGSRFARTLLRDVLDIPLTLTLMPLHETKVEVRDASGNPVTGAKVEGLVDFGQTLPSFIADETDAAGQTRLRIPEGVRIHDVIALKSGVGFDYFGNQSKSESALLDFLEEKRRIASRLPDSVQLTLDGAVAYRAQFKDSDGKPIAGLRVAPQTLQKPGKPHDLNTTFSIMPHTVTDAQGIAVFDWIPARLEGDEIQLSISYGQYPTWERPEFKVKAPDDDRTEPDMVVELAIPAIVTGRITDPDGAPLSDVAVENGALALPTDADGRYRVEVVPASDVNGDQRTITLMAPGWAKSVIRVTVPGPGETVENVDAVLRRGRIVPIQVVVDEGRMSFAQVHERIYDLGRLPATGPFVTIGSSGEDASPFHDLLPFDEDGRCLARLVPGTYKLTPQIPFFKVDEREIEFTVPEDGEPPAPTIQASSIAAKVFRFRVVRFDAPEAGLAGATVWFNRDLTAMLHRWRQAQTDAEGRVRVLRADDTVGYLACSEDRNWVALGVVDSDASGEITIAMKPAATVKGRFVDRRGDPICDGYVHLTIDPFIRDRNLANLSPGRPMPGQAVAVAGDGTFELTGVATGLAYRVSLRKVVETIRPSGGRTVGSSTVGSERIKVNDAGSLDVGDIECEYEPVEPRKTEPTAPVALKTFDVAAAEKAIADARTASAPSFHGTVTDSQGQPVPGCEVRLIAVTAPAMTAPLYRSEPVKTDQQGHYSLSTGPVQDAVAAIGIRAWSPDGMQMGHVDPRGIRKLYSATLERLTQEPFHIQLAPVEETIVHVQDGEGQPIADASVEAYVSGHLPPLAPLVTDAEGNATLRYEKEAGIYRVLALKSKQGLDWIDNRAPGGGFAKAAGPLPDRVEITLGGARTRRIQLVDTTGRALQGLTVRPHYLKKANRSTTHTFGWSSVATVVTDEQGIATFDWLPSDASTVSGGPTVSFDPASYIYCLGYGFRVPFNPSEPDGLHHVVLAPSAVVSGRVTKPDGSPVAGVRIYPETHDNQNPVCYTDAEGRYSFRVMPNKFEGSRPNSIGSAPEPIGVVVSNFSRDNPWVAKPIGPLLLTPGQTLDNADFQLSQGTQIKVQLVIDDGDTSYAELLETIQEQDPPVREKPRFVLTFLESEDAPRPAVEVVNPNRSDRLYSKSINFDELGQASFTLPPGSFRLRPSVPCVTYELPEGADREEKLVRERPQTEFVISDTDTERTFEIRVLTDVTKEYRLRTVLADDPEVVVADVNITVEPDTRAVIRSIELTTNDDGEAAIRRSGRPLTFLAYSADRKLGASEEWLRLDPDAEVVIIPMRPTRTATGRFLDKSGQPLKQCRVVCSTTRTMPLYSKTGNSRLMLRDPTIEITTDDDGRFEIEDLIPGVGYEVRAWKYLDEYEKSMPMGQKEIEIPLDEPADPIDCGDIRGQY